MKINRKTDLWSLGVVIYEMATLGLPFEGESISQLYDSIMKKDYKSIPASYSSNLSKLIDKMLRKNSKNRPEIGRHELIVEDLLYYDDVLVKAGVTIYGHNVYQKLIAPRKRVVTGSSWLSSIKNYKLLKQYLNHFNVTYRTAIGGLNNSIDYLPSKKEIEDNIVEYDEIGKLKPTNFDPTETGDLMKRLHANQLRVDECLATEYIVSRISKVAASPEKKPYKNENKPEKDRDLSASRRTPKKADADLHFKYLKDHDLEDYYKSVYPQDKLKRVDRNLEIPVISKFESSED